MLAFKEQNCELTLAEGLEIYLGYLKENNKKIITEPESSILFQYGTNMLASSGIDKDQKLNKELKKLKEKIFHIHQNYIYSVL